MVTFIYKGEGERTFPSIGITVKQGESFEAPSDFKAPDIYQVKVTKANTIPKESEA